jgi:hypothetical protein
MLKKLVFALTLLGVTALAAGCNKGTTGSSVPAAAPTAIPTGTTALITALYQGNPLNNQPIMEFNTNGSTTNPQPSGAPIATQNTNTSGQTTFTGLTPGGYYCWRYQFVVNATTTSTQTYCGNAWAAGVQLGS